MKGRGKKETILKSPDETNITVLPNINTIFYPRDGGGEIDKTLKEKYFGLLWSLAMRIFLSFWSAAAESVLHKYLNIVGGKIPLYESKSFKKL